MPSQRTTPCSTTSDLRACDDLLSPGDLRACDDLFSRNNDCRVGLFPLDERDVLAGSDSE